MSLFYTMDSKPEQKVEDSPAYSIVYDETLGHQFVSTRDLEPGSLVLEDEVPVLKIPMWNPNFDMSNCATCLGCGFHIDLQYVDYRCSHCGWPLCDELCEKLPEHTDAECKLFASKNVKFPLHPRVEAEEDLMTPWIMHQFILILRTISLRINNLSRYEELMNLQSIPSLPSSNPNVVRAEKKIQDEIDILEKYFDFQQFQFSRDDMKKIIWILNINAFMSQDFDQFGQQRYRLDLLYTEACQANNSCVPNCCHSVLPSWPKFLMTIRTAVPVKKDEPLTILYSVESMKCTMDRQLDLNKNFYFSCLCPRCSDPTELNTFFSAVVCNNCEENCEEGYLLPVNLLKIDDDPLWKCNKCDQTTVTSSLPVLMEIEELKQVLRAGSGVELELEEIDEVLDYYKGKVVHNNHWIIQLSVERYLQTVNRTRNTDLEFYLRNFDKYKEFSLYRLAIEDVVSPGISYYRGMIQWKLCQMILTFLESKERDQSEDLVKLCRTLLNESLRYFSNFTKGAPHGELIYESLKDLNERFMLI